MTEIKEPGLVGSVLGNFRIVGTLSSGGMGAVYRAAHATQGNPAAIKVLRPELTGNDELVQRFFTEAKAASAIRDPGIIEIYDFGYTEDGLAFIVMELLEGQSLAQRLRELQRLPELHAASIACGIASALTAAHGKGIIHRDLKPDNVFLVPDRQLPYGERPKLLDFGIAKLRDPIEGDTPHTRTGALIGTPLYMPPEQALASGQIDERADLYSLGCILYELLVGAPPFVAEGAGEIIAMQMFAAPEPPSVRLPSLSPELEQITLRLLDKEPARRYASAAETADALAGMLGKLSGRRATVIPSAGASLPSRLFTPPAFPAVSEEEPSGKLPHAPVDREPPPIDKRSWRVPVLAGALTLAIAGTAIAFVWTHGDAAMRAAAGPSDARVAPNAPVASLADAAVAAPTDAAPPVAAPSAGSARSAAPSAREPARPRVSPAAEPADVATAPLAPARSAPPATLHDAAPAARPDRDHTAGHSPIYQDLDDGSAAAPRPATP